MIFRFYGLYNDSEGNNFNVGYHLGCGYSFTIFNWPSIRDYWTNKKPAYSDYGKGNEFGFIDGNGKSYGNCFLIRSFKCISHC